MRAADEGKGGEIGETVEGGEGHEVGVGEGREFGFGDEGGGHSSFPVPINDTYSMSATRGLQTDVVYLC
jgi:hypothetical protein